MEIPTISSSVLNWNALNLTCQMVWLLMSTEMLKFWDHSDQMETTETTQFKKANASPIRYISTILKFKPWLNVPPKHSNSISTELSCGQPTTKSKQSGTTSKLGTCYGLTKQKFQRIKLRLIQTLLH